MALSRIRLQLALVFTLAFAAGLAVLAAIALGFLWRESHRRLDARLEQLSNDVHLNLARELDETPDSSLAFIATEVVSEWPRNGGTFVICDSIGAFLASSDGSKLPGSKRDGCGNRIEGHYRARGARGESIQVVGRRFRIADSSATPQAVLDVFDVVAWGSTAGISEDTELLLTAIAITAPLILLLSLSGGYLMARRALRPVTDLEIAISSIAPTDLSHRLTVVEPRDELGALAATFNAMLTRLSSAQLQNRKFLREAAHQIRTPLTLVLGEAAFELDSTDSSPERMRDSLTRINRAAERMRRRVDELFLLAEAQSGEPVRLRDDVELDGLVLSAVDLMRPRSTALGRALAIGTVQPVVVRGNSELLSEALLELLENALRHGDASAAVTVSVQANAGVAVLQVESGGVPFALPSTSADESGPGGIGLPIVRWVAEAHRGVLQVSSLGGINTVHISIPAIAPMGVDTSVA